MLDSRGGQQDEPGLALSPDGPGASPEPPTLSNTPEGNVATDTLASEMLRKLAGGCGVTDGSQAWQLLSERS